jgi:small subunit ribosomal protein S6
MALRRYEMMVILDSSQSEDELDKQIKTIEEKITGSEGGEIINTDRWGKKRLAYEVKGRQFGYYVVFEFHAESGFIAELERHCRLDNNNVRHMVLEISPKVLKLKEREKELKANLEARRKAMAEQAEEAPVVDLISDEDEEQGKGEAGEQAEAAEDAEEKSEETAEAGEEKE